MDNLSTSCANPGPLERENISGLQTYTAMEAGPLGYSDHSINRTDC